MAGQSTIPIRSWSKEDQTKHDVPLMISRIIQYRGGFQDVTEESLEEEIRNAELAGKDDMQADGEDEDEKPQAAQMDAAKAEISKFATQAYNETAQALDMISLLLSKYTPSAESTVSPFLRANVPFKSLGAELVQRPVVSEARQQHDQLVSTGWKLEALSSAADSLLKSAIQLEDQMKKETTYWKQVLTIKEKGWTVSRMPQDRHTLGVRFGFLESPPDFRDRSMATLKREEDGSVDLDLGFGFPGKKLLKARVIQGHKTIAVSNDVSDNMDSGSVESAILQARNNILDAELFFELLKESRDLISHGVQSSSSKVSIPLGNETMLILEQADPKTSYHQVQSSQSKYRNLPQLILTALRILLSHSHSVYHRQRTRNPPVIGEEARKRSSPALLAPILAHLAHQRHQKELVSQLERFFDILAKAGVVANLSKPRHKLDLERLLQSKSIIDTGEFAHTLLSNLTGDIAITLPIQVNLHSEAADGPKSSVDDLSLEVTIRTTPSVTEYRLLIQSDIGNEDLKALYRETAFDNSGQVYNEIISTIHLYILNTLAARSQNKLHVSHGNMGLYIETPAGDAHEIEIDLTSDSLSLLYKDPESQNGEGLADARVWNVHSATANGNTAGISSAVEELTANIIRSFAR